MANLFTTTATDWSYGYNPPKASDFDTYGMPEIVEVADDFIGEFARIVTYLKRQNDYERSEANRADCLGMFGADDIARNIKEYTTAYKMDYPRYPEYAMTAYNRQRVLSYYYKCWQVLAKYFYGYEFSTSRYPSSIGSEYGTVTNYSRIITEDYYNIGIAYGAFWKHPRATGGEYASSGRNGIESTDPNCVFCGDIAWISSFQSNREKAVNDFVTIITYIMKIDHLRTELVDCLPTSQGGNGKDSASYNPKFSNYYCPGRNIKQFSLLPTPVCQVRQILAKVMLNSNYGTDDWQPWTYAGQVQCSIAVQDGLSERGIINAIIPDKTIDPSKSSIYNTPVSDPLVVAGTGYGVIASADGDLGHLAPVVSLRRQYMFRRYCSNYDYPEPDNPNAFEKKYGRVRYGHSNLRQWLNSVKTGVGAWAVKAHDTDAFAGTAAYSYGYLNHISAILRSNLAKVEYTYPSGSANAIVNNTCAVSIAEDWVAIPNMTQFGYSNYSGTRKTDRIAVDDVVHGEYYFRGEYGEIEEGNSSFCAEDNWRPAMTSHWYHKFAYNPNFATPTTSTARRCPSRTPANSAYDSYDATISNLVAGMASNDDGSTAPTKTTSQPYFIEDGLMVYFTVAAFHADKIDPSLPSTNIHGVKLES